MTCGIYSIIHKESGKIYIGQSVNIERRFKQHCQYSQKKAYIDRSINKWGVDAFEFKILYECPEDELDIEEEKFINLYGSYATGYNLTKGGDFAPTKLPEVKEKISAAKKGKNHHFYGVKGKNNPLFGRKHSDEFKKKVSVSLKKYYSTHPHPSIGRKHSDETKQKISDKNKGRYYPLELKLNQSKHSNSTGYFRVSKKRCKNCLNGFTYMYRYCENGKQKAFYSKSLEGLKEKCLLSNLPWRVIDNHLALVTRLECNSLKQNTSTGVKFVTKTPAKTCRVGYLWRYDSQKGSMSSISLDDLKEKVLSEGLEWIILDEKKYAFQLEQSQADLKNVYTPPTPFKNVSKIKYNKAKQGFTYVYRYRGKDGKKRRIQSVDLSNLKKKVLDKGLEWTFI